MSQKLLWARGLDLFRALFSTALKLESQKRAFRTWEGEAAAASLGTTAKDRVSRQQSSYEAQSLPPRPPFLEREQSHIIVQAEQENAFAEAV